MFWVISVWRIGWLVPVLALLPVFAMARDQVRVVGSSTVYPFAVYVADELGSTTEFKTPLIESTGTTAGLSLFCAGLGTQTPDIANASRRMRYREFEDCREHGVTDITEVNIGQDGIVVACARGDRQWDLTPLQLVLALAAKVPQGSAWVNNAHVNWQAIDPSFPDQAIRIYGPPATSGTRDILLDFIGRTLYAAWPDRELPNLQLRADTAYVSSGENDNLIVMKLGLDTEAFGLFGFSYLEENRDTLQAAAIAGVLPERETIRKGSYPLSRELYLYLKNAHRDTVPSLLPYVKLFLSEAMLGEDGRLTELGLIAPACETRCRLRRKVQDRIRLQATDLGKG